MRRRNCKDCGRFMAQEEGVYGLCHREYARYGIRISGEKK